MSPPPDEATLPLPPTNNTPPGVGDYVRFSEVAFFHKASKTLMVTDAVVFVPDDAPEVISNRALLYNAQDGLLQRAIAGGKTRAEVRGVSLICAAACGRGTPAACRGGLSRRLSAAMPVWFACRAGPSSGGLDIVPTFQAPVLLARLSARGVVLLFVDKTPPGRPL
jgi:hypothetical protein